MEELTQRVRQDYDRWGDDWRQKVWIGDGELEQQITDFMDLPEVGVMLDVATGAGDFGSLFSARQIVGVDLSGSMLLSSELHHPEHLLCQADGSNLPFANDTFDQVVSRNFLQNFEDPHEGFDEMIRVLRPGGRIAIMETAVNQGEEDYPAQVARVVEPYHRPFPSHESLSVLMREAGVMDVEQAIAGIKRRFLSGWAASKGATDAQRMAIYNVCLKYPEDYKQRYQYEFFPDECEVSSLLTFSMLKGRKPESTTEV